jgi:hypothetical protein
MLVTRLSGSTEKEANKLTEGNQKIYVQKQKQTVGPAPNRENLLAKSGW